MPMSQITPMSPTTTPRCYRSARPWRLLFLSYVALAAFFFTTSPAAAAGPPCRPCAGIRVDSPDAVLPALAAAPRLEDEARLYVSWPAALDGLASNAPFAAVRNAGGTPWMRLSFGTPAPVLDHLDQLDQELKAVAKLAKGAGERAHFQIVWPFADSAPPSDFAFLLKRAAVAITGGQPDARVIAGPLAADPERLRTLYEEEVAAYVDGIALVPTDSGTLATALETLGELDPGKPVVVDALPWPATATRTLVMAAANAQAGVDVTLFDFRDQPAEALAPLKLLAREFQGDLSFDPYSLPRGAQGAWTFVRGSDLGLRVIVEAAGEEPVPLTFDDPQLRSPTRIDLESGEDRPVFDQRRLTKGLLVPVEPQGEVALLRLERMTAEELEGLEEEVTVADERQLPVEEILRRLQAFEDAQARKLTTYTATHTMHLRFRLGNGLDTIEATFEGDFFYRRGQGFDWAWETFYINGVKWRGKKLPEIPLVQPEKAATLPLEINFDKKYTYRLRGTDTTEGRDCWVVDFEPLEVVPGKSLYQGTVWIDRTLYARVKTRALQVGLEGEVISNEETVFFTPIDAQGQPGPWAAESYFLPLRITGQQLLSVLNATTQVEKENLLTAVRLNPQDFETVRQAALDSDVTMVRDTQAGLRYLVKDEDGEGRVVQEGFDSDRLFLLGGVFYDNSLDFPLPLAGVNYLSFDFRGSGNQVNVFFAGALLVANVAEPRLFGSRWDAGVNLFGFFIDSEDTLYRDGEEVEPEAVEDRVARASLFLGRPLGNFTKLDFAYELEQRSYGRADDTAEDFIVPNDTLIHGLKTELTYSRSGYRLSGEVAFHQRDDWEFWGLPGNDEFDPEQEDYLLWEASVAKTWWLPKFTKLGVELEHLDGEDLDRFSKYDYSFFGDARVRGYPSGLVRASDSNGLHLNYGFDLGELLRVEVNGDAVWANDDATGLDNELLAGVGLNGTVVGPWQTIVNFDIGFPVEGPADDFVAYLVFLKLFR